MRTNFDKNTYFCIDFCELNVYNIGVDKDIMPCRACEESHQLIPIR